MTAEANTTRTLRGGQECRESAHPSSRVRVLQFITNLFIGGTERQVTSLTGRLDTSRFEPYVGCLIRQGQLLDEIIRLGILVAEYRVRRLYGARTLWEGLRLARDLRRMRIDVVHTYTFHGNVFAIPAARLAGVSAVVASIRDRGVDLSPWHERAQHAVCRLAHRIAVNSQGLRRRLVAQGHDPARIVVIRNGIDMSKFRPRSRSHQLRRELGLPADAPVVAVFSRLIPVKGLDYFLEAAARVAARAPEARFLVVGDNQAHNVGYRTTLERATARLGLEGRVVFAGWRLDVPNLLAETTVSVLPSVIDEGLPNVVLEAMAAGVPVVATDVEGSTEALENEVTGLVVRPRDADALADAICRFLETPSLAARFGAAGRERVAQHFSIDRYVRETEALYLDLLGRSGRREGARPSRYEA